MQIHSLEKVSAKMLYCLILRPFSLPFTLMWKNESVLKKPAWTVRQPTISYWNETNHTVSLRNFPGEHAPWCKCKLGKLINTLAQVRPALLSQNLHLFITAGSLAFKLYWNGMSCMFKMQTQSKCRLSYWFTFNFLSLHDFNRGFSPTLWFCSLKLSGNNCLFWKDTLLI